MRLAGFDSVERLEELESHLWEEFEAQMRSGQSQADAFEMAAEQIGRPEVLRCEFAKVRRDGHSEARHDKEINPQGPISLPDLFLRNSQYRDPLQR